MENLLTYMTFIPLAGAAIVLALPNNAKLIRLVSAAATVPPLLMAIWLFANFDRSQAGFTAPAQGLYLLRIDYA